jgi:GntR family transcriptional regulator / MocR family aminotransferase
VLGQGVRHGDVFHAATLCSRWLIFVVQFYAVFVSHAELDMHLTLDRSRGLRAGLERALRDAIRAGTLPAGTRLPPSRALAADLDLSRGTVTQAFDQLIAEGYLISTPRTAVEVAPAPDVLQPSTDAVDRPSLAPAPRVDLRPGTPDLSSFPRRQWQAATRHVLQHVPTLALGYGNWTGTGELRSQLAGYLGRARGVATDPEHIIVCAGYTHALHLLCNVLRHLGLPTIGFEEPAHQDYPDLACRAALRVSHVPVDSEGLVIDSLADEAAVVVTPAHQYPLGVTLSPARRAALLAWAHRHGAFVVEDDYDGEFRYDRRPVGALQGLDPDHVIYAGTTSKALAPGLRMAWLAVPSSLLQAFQEVLGCEDANVSIIDQLVLARLIDSGEFDRHVRRCRNRYRRRRDQLEAAVVQHLPRARLSGIAAGLHAVMELPGTRPDADLSSYLDRFSVAVDNLSYYYRDPSQAPSGVVIGYGTPAEHDYRNALTTLVTALSQRSTGPTSCGGC